MQSNHIHSARPEKASDLFKKVCAIQRAGLPLTAQNANRIFGRGHDVRLRSNAERAAGMKHMVCAIKHGVITDHRAIGAILGMGDVPSSIVLALETRLGRHLSRERIYALKDAYQGVLDRKESNVVCLDRFRRMVNAISQGVTQNLRTG